MLVGLFAGALTLVGRPEPAAKTILPSLGGGNMVASLVGCLPALAGFFAGWRNAKKERRAGRSLTPTAC